MRPIAISLSPNLERQDALLALRLLFSPWAFLKGKSVKSLEQWFRRNFRTHFAVSFVSGRTALFYALKALGIGSSDEVILQAFTCVAVPNAVVWSGAKPIYADIGPDLNIDPLDFERKITSRTKAIIVQHTLGIPAKMEAIKKIAKKHKLFIIEDCAHSLGIEDKTGKKLGQFGDVVFFSFGRDKMISSVFGGMVLTNNKVLGKKLRSLQKQQENPSFFWVAQQLFHPIVFFFFVLPLYNFFLGKLILVVLQKIRFLSFPVTSSEKLSKMPSLFTRKLPNALAYLALLQLKRLQEFNYRRAAISKMYLNRLDQACYAFPYKSSIPYLRFPVLVDEGRRRDDCIDFLKKHKLYVGKWYSEVIDPKGVDFKKIGYRRGLCPNAEFLAKKIINLPTYPTMQPSEVKKIVSRLNKYAQDKRNFE